MLAPISWRVPPRRYGPWERVVSLLTEGLVARGVDVTLFATADSLTAARLEAVCPRPLAEDPSLDRRVWEGIHIANAFERASSVDLLHNHLDFVPLTYTRLVATPMVTTIHGFSSSRIRPVFRRYDDRVHYVSISDADRDPALGYCATIHHGVSFEELPFGPGGEDLLFFGRIHPDKGVLEAIEVARHSGRRLVIAGLVHDQRYFRREVDPRIDGDRVRYVGVVDPSERNELLGASYALLHLVNFDEPFGLSLIEAMACGTPVIATRRGSIPEVVDDGVTGFIVDGPTQAVESVPRIATLDRRRVRAHASHRFSRERMVDDYMALYQRIRGGMCVSGSA
jgi:glycosyltransferase involved in cell wall biosynthesis